MKRHANMVDKDQKVPLTSVAEPSTPAPEAPNNASAKNDQLFRLFLLFLMTAQNSSVVLLSRYTRTVSSKDEMYVINDIVMVSEMAKFFLAAALEQNHTNGHLMQSIRENIIERPIDALKIMIPSLLYLVQNSLLYVAISNLTAPMFQVTYQCKLLTTAIVSVAMLQRKYSLKQWVCLTALGIGVAIVVLGAQDKGDDKKEDAANAQNLAAGLLAVTVACLCSAFAGVYFEKVLKRPTVDGGQARAPVSMWMRNIQMAFFSVCIALINMARETDEARGYTGEFNEDTNQPIVKPFMHGFTIYAYGIVFLQAGGGMLVAAVIKYADNVLKGMATGVSVVTATFFSMFLFGTTLSGQFALGAGIILVSVYLFSNDLPACGRGNSKGSVEMNNLLPK